MGCLFSKSEENHPYGEVVKNGDQKLKTVSDHEKLTEHVEKPAVKKPKINIEDLRVENLKNQAVTREQGKLQGQMVEVGDLDNCDVFLCDHLDSAYVDKCTNCRIFIGPTAGSVFVRDCTNCDFVIACHQLRMRDSSNLRLALCAMTQPSIETSTDIKFGCFDFNYFSLKQQMESAGLKPWNNKWWNIHDFSKPAGGTKQNWSLMDQKDCAKLIDVNKCTCIGADEQQMLDPVVPVTLGSRPKPLGLDDKNSCVIFFPNSKQHIENFVEDCSKNNWVIVNCRSMLIDAGQREQLFSFDKTKIKSITKKTPPVEFTVFEFCTRDKGAEKWWAETERYPSEKCHLVPATHSEGVCFQFFNAWDDMI